MNNKHNVEILAPVGNIEVLDAAISGGANAVYLAGKQYGARSFAGNFSDIELVEAIKKCHLYDIKVYVTINTVIFESEIDDCIKYIDFLYENDVDAIIVQDLGLASIVIKKYPSLSVHASTQVNAQTLEDVMILKKIGFKRVIMGREVSIDTIKHIKENVDIEIEAFVHGALCISYSGNCYFSLLEGGRSGNRGKCAQVCRLKHSFCGSEKYYLSPKDLCTINNINDISKYVDSLKIEGRMKSKEYVYNTVKAYAHALEGKNDIEELMYKVKTSFNRGFTRGFILNEKNSQITNVTQSNHLGVYIGNVVYSTNNNVQVKLSSKLLYNDSIRILGKKDDGITINQMYVKGKLVKEANPNDIVSIRTHHNLNIDDKVYLTKREENYLLPKILVEGKAYIEDDNFVFEVFDGKRLSVKKAKYEKTDKDLETRIKDQLLKVGSYPFSFSSIKMKAKGVYLPIKEINNLRRLALDELIELRQKRNYRYSTLQNDECITKIDNNTINDELLYIVSSKAQFDLLNKTCFTRYGDNENVCLQRVENTSINLNGNNRILFSNIGFLNKKDNYTLLSSIYNNVTNSYTVKLFNDLGVSCVGLSLELSKKNIFDLVKGYKKRYNTSPPVYVMVYGYYQMMYLKHCFVNKELKYNNLNCNGCLNKYLDDKYPLFRDKDCHLAVLYEKPVNLLDKVDELKEIGIKHFLVDYTIENDIRTLDEYRLVIDKYIGCY